MSCGEKLEPVVGELGIYDLHGPVKSAVVIYDSGYEIEYTFDRLSLCVYSHNLDSDSFSELKRILSEKAEEKFNREEVVRMSWTYDAWIKLRHIEDYQRKQFEAINDIIRKQDRQIAILTRIVQILEKEINDRR